MCFFYSDFNKRILFTIKKINILTHSSFNKRNCLIHHFTNTLCDISLHQSIHFYPPLRTVTFSSTKYILIHSTLAPQKHSKKAPNYLHDDSHPRHRNSASPTQTNKTPCRRASDRRPSRPTSSPSPSSCKQALARGRCERISS